MKKQNTLKYYRWGNEPAGLVSTWRLGEKGEVVHCGYMDMMEAIQLKLVYDCPYN